jgi:hypothetical protein
VASTELENQSSVVSTGNASTTTQSAEKHASRSGKESWNVLGRRVVSATPHIVGANTNVVDTGDGGVEMTMASSTQAAAAAVKKRASVNWGKVRTITTPRHAAAVIADAAAVKEGDGVGINGDGGGGGGVKDVKTTSGARGVGGALSSDVLASVSPPLQSTSSSSSSPSSSSPRVVSSFARFLKSRLWKNCKRRIGGFFFMSSTEKMRNEHKRRLHQSGVDDDRDPYKLNSYNTIKEARRKAKMHSKRFLLGQGNKDGKDGDGDGGGIDSVNKADDVVCPVALQPHDVHPDDWHQPPKHFLIHPDSTFKAFWDIM